MNENYPYSMPTWLIILITALGTIIIGTGIRFFLCCKYKHASNHSEAFSISWKKENPRETEVMLLGSSQQAIDSP